MKSKHVTSDTRPLSRSLSRSVTHPVTRSSILRLLASLAASTALVQTSLAQPGVMRPATQVRWPAPEALAATPPSAESEADALIAPLALYPERIVRAIFRASQQPLDVVRAARWLRANAANAEAAPKPDPTSQPWFNSIADLFEEPALIEAMDADIDRTQRIGELARTHPELLWSAVDRRRAASGLVPTGQLPTVQAPSAQGAAPALASSRPSSPPLPTTRYFPEPAASEPAPVASFSNDALFNPDFSASEDISSVILPSTIATPVWATPVFVAPFAPRRSVWFVSGWSQPWCGWNDGWAFRWRNFYSRPSFALSVSIGSDPWRWSRWDCRPISSWHRSSVVIVSRPVSRWDSGWSHWNQPFCEPAWDSGLSLSVSFNNSSRSGWGHGWGNSWGHGSRSGWINNRWNGHANNNWNRGGYHRDDRDDRNWGDDRDDRNWGDDRDNGGQGDGDRGEPSQWASGSRDSRDSRDSQDNQDTRIDRVGPSPASRGAFGATSRPQQAASNSRGWPLLRAPQLAAENQANLAVERTSDGTNERGYQGSRRVLPPTDASADASQRTPSRLAPRVASFNNSQSVRPAPGLMRVAERARRTTEPLAATISTIQTSQTAPQSQPAPRAMPSRESAQSAPRPIPSIRPADNIRRGVAGTQNASGPRQPQRVVVNESRDQTRAQNNPQPSAVQSRPEPRPQPRIAQPSPARNTSREAAPRSAYPVARAAQSRAPEQAPKARPQPAAAPAPQPAAQPQPAARSQPAARKPVPSIRPRDNIRRGIK